MNNANDKVEPAELPRGTGQPPKPKPPKGLYAVRLRSLSRRKRLTLFHAVLPTPVKAI